MTTKTADLFTSAEPLSIADCVRVATKLLAVCEPAALEQLPFQSGFANPARARHARELADRLNLAFSELSQ